MLPTDGDLPSLRAALIANKSAANARFPDLGKTLVITDHQIPVRECSEIGIRIYQPQDVASSNSEDDSRPVFIMLHGGGWALGGLENEVLSCKLLSERLGMVVVDVDYRLAPEWKFPTGLNDAHDAVKWVFYLCPHSYYNQRRIALTGNK